MNGSRVIGPAIGAFLYAQYGASWVFLLNALSYVAIILVLVRVPLPKPVPSRHPGPPPPARRCPLRPAGQGGRPLPRDHLHLLAALPAVHHPDAHGRRREPRHRARRASPTACSTAPSAWAPSSARCRSAPCSPVRRRRGSPATGCSRSPAFLTLFALLRDAAPAYPVIFGLGAVYFAVITSLSTVLQQDLDDSVRGKVMALWIMGFGGTVPIGGLLGGLISEQPGHHLGDARRRRRRRGAGRVRPARAGAGGRRRASPPPTDVNPRRAPPPARSRPATRLPFTSTTSPSPSGPSRSITSSRSADVGDPVRRARPPRSPRAPAPRAAHRSPGGPMPNPPRARPSRPAPRRGGGPGSAASASRAEAIDVGLAL